MRFWLRLLNKLALITGAAQGIGEATARLFVEEGATVVLCDKNAEKLMALQSELKIRTFIIQMDVSKQEDWRMAYGIVSNLGFGCLDVLFNNAGILGTDLGPQDPENCTLENWNHIHEVNLNSIFLSFKTMVPLLRKSANASVINMSSRSGKVGVPQNSAYASSKAAIINLTKSMALYCAQKKYPIRVNSLLPAAIDTPIWDPLLQHTESREEAKKALARDIPLGRMGKPEEVAYAALYLASNESLYTTGTEIILDGGILAGSAASPEKR